MVSPFGWDGCVAKARDVTGRRDTWRRCLAVLPELRHTYVVIIEPAERHTEQETRTRARVLAAVSERGPVSASALGRLLGLTPAGVRRHLEALAEHGAVSEHDPVTAATGRGRGRPAREWVVAEAGHASLTSGYDDLAAQALRFLRDAAGPDAVAAFARARSADVEARYAADLASVGPLPQARVEALVSVLTRDGFAASARPVGEGARTGVQVCQGHCPIHHVAAEFPQLCQAETDAFSRLLGVHVQRLSTLARGQHVCTTFVPIPAVPESKGVTS